MKRPIEEYDEIFSKHVNRAFFIYYENHYKNTWDFHSTLYINNKLKEKLDKYKYFGFDKNLCPMFTNNIEALPKKYQRNFKIKEMLGEKQMKVFECTTPTDIVIFGSQVGGNYDFSIDDDYWDLDVQFEKDKETSIETDGFVSIKTLEDFEGQLEEGEDYGEGIIIKDFVGELNLIFKDWDGNLVSSENIDITDWIVHQNNNICDAIINVEGHYSSTEIIDMQ